MEGAIILHETLQELHTKKQDGLFLKYILRRLMIRLNEIFYNKR